MIIITPIYDLKEHIQTEECECNPRVYYAEGEKVISHNSFDERETKNYKDSNWSIDRI